MTYIIVGRRSNLSDSPSSPGSSSPVFSLPITITSVVAVLSVVACVSCVIFVCARHRRQRRQQVVSSEGTSNATTVVKDCSRTLSKDDPRSLTEMESLAGNSIQMPSTDGCRSEYLMQPSWRVPRLPVAFDRAGPSVPVYQSVQLNETQRRQNLYIYQNPRGFKSWCPCFGSPNESLTPPNLDIGNQGGASKSLCYWCVEFGGLT